MQPPKEMSHEDVITLKLQVLKREHQDLDDIIHALQDRASQDALLLQRLKRKKLALKDQMRAINNELTPDIIA
ncbi:MAG: YdcH family protein [Halocynthiibacter sp.]